MGKTENCSPQSLFNFVYNPAPYGGSRHLTWGISIFNVYILIASIVIFVTDTHTQENKQCYKILRVWYGMVLVWYLFQQILKRIHNNLLHDKYCTYGSICARMMSLQRQGLLHHPV